MHITHHFVNITEGLQATILNICHEHIQKMSESYLKPFISKENAENELIMHFEKNKQEKYEGRFEFLLDWAREKVIYTNDTPFKEPLDVANHAFKRLKEHLAKK